MRIANSEVRMETAKPGKNALAERSQTRFNTNADNRLRSNVELLKW